MITGFNRLTAVSAPGIRADVHVSLAIEGKADRPFGFIADSIRCMGMCKDFICLCNFFRLALGNLFLMQAHFFEFADCSHYLQPLPIAYCEFMFLRRLLFNLPGYRHWTKRLTLLKTAWWSF